MNYFSNCEKKIGCVDIVKNEEELFIIFLDDFILYYL